MSTPTNCDTAATFLGSGALVSGPSVISQIAGLWTSRAASSVSPQRWRAANGCLADLDKKTSFKLHPWVVVLFDSIPYSDSSFKTLKLNPYYHDRTLAIDNALFAQSQQKTQSNRTLERQSVPVSALTVTISSCLSSPASSSSFPAPHVWIRSEALFQTFQRCNFCSLYSTNLGAEGANGKGSGFKNGFSYDPYAGCMCLLSFRIHAEDADLQPVLSKICAKRGSRSIPLENSTTK